MLEVKRAAGVTLNDVLLTMVGGALLDVLGDLGDVLGSKPAGALAG